ncbi:hypothetical protein E2542_SST08380 [Spatholobus suberectus]|nr:hypothetical protein E2542_SST08380 [Spatholobus suberectus]
MMIHSRSRKYVMISQLLSYLSLKRKSLLLKSRSLQWSFSKLEGERVSKSNIDISGEDVVSLVDESAVVLSTEKECSGVYLKTVGGCSGVKVVNELSYGCKKKLRFKNVKVEK